MQLSKVLLVIGATSVCLTPLPGRTADKASVAPLVAPAPATPEAVEKARAAMRQKMEEVQPTAAAAASQAPAQAAPAAEAAAPARLLIPVADSAAIDKARAALHQKMAELNSQPDQATPASAMGKTRAARYQNSPSNPATPAPAIAKTQAALHQKMIELNGQPDPATLPTAKLAKAHSGFEPISGPPSPLSAAKQQRLNDLLVKYKADQVTPEQYHAERAKILAEP